MHYQLSYRQILFVNYEIMFGQLAGGSFRNHPGVIPGSIQDNYGVILGSFRGLSGFVPRTFRDHSGVILGSFQDDCRIISDRLKPNRTVPFMAIP